jgi:uncharacterized BrkB/YihY/UPF0761 family membrane protein
MNEDERVTDPPDESPAAGAPEPPSRLDRLRTAANQARERVEAKRETSVTVGVAYDAFGHDVEAGGPVLAAALGFRVFLFIVPYVGFFLILAGYIADIFDKRPDELVHGKGIAGLTAQGISTGHDWSKSARVSALVLVTYALFISARSFLKVLRIVHTLVWRAAPTRMLHATRATFVFIGVVSVSLILSGLIDALRQRTAIGGIAALGLLTLVGFAAWWLVSWWLPHGDCDPLGLIPGAVAFAVGIEALHIATVVWFPHSMKSKSEIYGAIGTALVLLLWAYLLGRLMALGAALNYALWRRRPARSIELPGFVAKLPLVGPWIDRVWTTLTPPVVVTPPADITPVADPPVVDPPD